MPDNIVEQPLHEKVLDILYNKSAEKPTWISVEEMLWSIPDPTLTERQVREVLDWLVYHKRAVCEFGKYQIDRIEFIERGETLVSVIDKEIAGKTTKKPSSTTHPEATDNSDETSEPIERKQAKPQNTTNKLAATASTTTRTKAATVSNPNNSANTSSTSKTNTSTNVTTVATPVKNRKVLPPTQHTEKKLYWPFWIATGCLVIFCSILLFLGVRIYHNMSSTAITPLPTLHQAKLQSLPNLYVKGQYIDNDSVLNMQFRDISYSFVMQKSLNHNLKEELSAVQKDMENMLTYCKDNEKKWLQTQQDAKINLFLILGALLFLALGLLFITKIY